MSPAVETYEQAIEYLFGRINYERIHAAEFSARDFKLDRMRLLLQALGNPQESIPCVHIAGTKGKGSTAVMISHILTAAGYRTGLFTSPHIDAFEERMKVDGVTPSREALVGLVNDLAPVITKLDRMPGRMNPTYFEIATAMAWSFFAQRDTDIVVLEVGLGGRLDSTNLCNPLVTVITSISRDHINVLGSSIREIAREKAGILKDNVPVVSGVTDPEASDQIRKQSIERNASLIEIGAHIHVESSQDSPNRSDAPTINVVTPWREWNHIPQPLIGNHQANNVALAVTVADVLGDLGFHVPSQAAHRGLNSVRWPLRIEIVGRDPTVIVDAAHNWESIKALLSTLDSHFTAGRRILIFATTKDKDVAGMLRLLTPRFDTVILTQYQNNPRAETVSHLRQVLSANSDQPVHDAPDPATAWKLAQHLARAGDLVCITGSFFIAAEMREIVTDCANQPASATKANSSAETKPLPATG